MACAAMLAGVGIADRADAQFAGDLFFIDPSVSVAVGGTATLELALFTGGDAFGIAQAEVSFDGNEMELVGVSLPDGVSDPVLQQFTKTESGVLNVITLNAVSKTEPIGSVIVAKLEVRPKLGSPGTVSVKVSNKGAFSAEGAAYSSSKATSGEVVVTSAPASFVASAAGEAELVADPSPELLARAAALVGPGGIAELVIPSGPDAGRTVLVRVPPDSSTPSE